MMGSPWNQGFVMINNYPSNRSQFGAHGCSPGIHDGCSLMAVLLSGRIPKETEL